jgi:ribosomal protein L9
LAKQNIEVDKKYIIINGINIIKTAGAFTASIRLHRDLKANLSFEVVGSKA